MNKGQPFVAQTKHKPARAQRAVGAVGLTARAENQKTKLVDLYQQGCLKALLPKTYEDGLEAVLVNTSGGLTGGDHLRVDLDLQSGAQLTFTTQAAERIYKSNQGHARVEATIKLGPKAHLFWLPQETILFDQSALNRKLQFSLHESANLVAMETLVFGRQAMKERINVIDLNDRWEIRVDEALKVTEALRINDAEFLNTEASLGSMRVATTLWMMGPDYKDQLGRAREILSNVSLVNLRVGLSALNGGLVLRLLASDSLTARETLIPFLNSFLKKPMPAVWRL